MINKNRNTENIQELYYENQELKIVNKSTTTTT